MGFAGFGAGSAKQFSGSRAGQVLRLPALGPFQNVCEPFAVGLNSSCLYICSQKTFSSSSVIGFASLRDRSSLPGYALLRLWSSSRSPVLRRGADGPRALPVQAPLQAPGFLSEATISGLILTVGAAPSERISQLAAEERFEHYPLFIRCRNATVCCSEMVGGRAAIKGDCSLLAGGCKQERGIPISPKSLTSISATSASRARSNRATLRSSMISWSCSEMLEEKILRLDNNPGGNLLESVEIGKTVREQKMNTWVPERTICVSGCAIIWIAGARRSSTLSSLMPIFWRTVSLAHTAHRQR